MKDCKGIVFFDVDGTLIDCFKGISAPTESTRKSIKKLKENKFLTILATGRPKSCIDENLLNLGLDGYIASNGAYADFKEDIIFDYPIDNEKLSEILDYFKENNIDYMLEGHEMNYISSYENKKLMELLEGAKLNMDYITDKWDRNKVKTSKIIIVNNENNEIFEKVSEKYKDGFTFMKHPMGVSFEMYLSKYTKGYGVKQLVNKLGIDMDKTYAFGDGENDIEMFQVVKHGIAMGGYHEKLEAVAYDFTENVENEGITKGLEKLELI